MSIKLEELATHWRTIIRDIHNLQTHINHLQELAATNIEQDRSKTPSLYKHDNYHQHTRQKSSEVLGPQAAEIFKLQNSTCEFWARCVNMYLERTTDRIRNSVSFLLSENLGSHRDKSSNADEKITMMLCVVDLPPS